MFLLQPGALLIDRADPSDSAAVVGALSSNAALSNLMTILIALGSVLLVFGLYVKLTTTPKHGADGLSRLGLVFIISETSAGVDDESRGHGRARAGGKEAVSRCALASRGWVG